MVTCVTCRPATGDGPLRATRAAPLPPDPEGQVRPRRSLRCSPSCTSSTSASSSGWTSSFGPGLTAVTGETGAGKTMLVEALELLVGGRADASIVRPGSQEVRVDGRFVVGDDQELVLTRVVPAERTIPGLPRWTAVDGRRARRGGRPASSTCTASTTTRACSARRPNGPPSTATARSTSNRCGRPGPGSRSSTPSWPRSVATRGRGHGKWTCCDSRSPSWSAADLADPDEDAVLERVEDELADAVGHREAGARAHAALADDGGSRDSLAAAVTALGGRLPFADVTARASSLLAELDDVVGDVRRVVDDIDEDPARLAEVRARRQLLRDLCRKYGDDLVEVRAYRRRRRSPARRVAALRPTGRRAGRRPS